VLVLCIGVALLRSICFTAPWTPVQRREHVKRAAGKQSAMTRLKKRARSILGRALEPEGLVVKVLVSLPGLKDVESVETWTAEGRGDSADSAMNQAAEMLLNSLREADAKRPKLSEGQEVTIKYVSTLEDGRIIKVDILESDSNAILMQDDFAAAFPDRDPQAGDTFKAKIWTLKNSRSKISEPIVTMHDGDFTSGLPDASQETKDLFMGLGEQMLDAEVMKRQQNGVVATVKSPDGKVATGFLPNWAMDDDFKKHSYPGKAFQARVQTDVDPDKVKAWKTVSLTME